MRPRDFGQRLLIKRVRGQTCVRSPERLPACFGMRLIDGHGIRLQE